MLVGRSVATVTDDCFKALSHRCEWRVHTVQLIPHPSRSFDSKQMFRYCQLLCPDPCLFWNRMLWCYPPKKPRLPHTAISGDAQQGRSRSFVSRKVSVFDCVSWDDSWMLPSSDAMPSDNACFFCNFLRSRIWARWPEIAALWLL